MGIEAYLDAMVQERSSGTSTTKKEDPINAIAQDMVSSRPTPTPAPIKSTIPSREPAPFSLGVGEEGLYGSDVPLKDIYKDITTPEPRVPIGSKKWFTENLPKSAYKLPLRVMNAMFYDIPKSYWTNIEAELADLGLKDSKQGSWAEPSEIMAEYGEKNRDLTRKHIWDILSLTLKSTGVWDISRDLKDGKVIYTEKLTPQELANSPYPDKRFKEKMSFKLPTFEEFTDFWSRDPAGAALSVAPIIKLSLSKLAARRAKTAAEVEQANRLAEKALKENRDLRAKEQTTTDLKYDSVKQAAESMEETVEAQKTVKKKKTKTMADRYKEFKAELDQTTTPEEVDAVVTKYITDNFIGKRGVERAKKLGEKTKKARETDKQNASVQKLDEEVKTEPETETPITEDKVSDLSTDTHEVVYDGEMEGLGHQITIMPAWKTKAQIMKEGSASTIYAKTMEEAQRKVNDVIEAYKDAEDLKGADLDNQTGIAPKPLKHPERSQFYQDEEMTRDRTDLFNNIPEDSDYSPSNNVKTYVQSLINEVNRYHHKMEGADIETARRKLSEFSAKIDSFMDVFLESELGTKYIEDYLGREIPADLVAKAAREDPTNIEMFEEFKSMVRDASNWARRVTQKDGVNETLGKKIPKDEEMGTVADIKYLGAGLPIEKIKELLSKADFIRLYHGSGKEFEVFKDEALRSGQGAQSRGSGHYLASDKEVARGYAKEYGKPTANPSVIIDNKVYNPDPSNEYFFEQYVQHKINKDKLISHLDETINKIKDNISRQKAGDSNIWIDLPVEEIRLKNIIREKELVINSNKIESIKEPTLYTISIKGGFQNKKWLDWDNPIGYTVAKLIKSQWNKVLSDKNAKIFKEADGKMFLNPADIDSSTLGSVVHRVLTYAFKDKFVIRPGVHEEAMTRVSKFLKEAGITGTMFDADTIAKSGTGKGTKNYVVYDPNDIKIERITRDRDATKLYSGLPGDKVKEYFNKVDLAKLNTGTYRDKAKSFMNEARRRFWSPSANLKNALTDSDFLIPKDATPLQIEVLRKLGYDTLQSMNLASGATSRSAHILRQHEREVYGGLSTHEKKVLDRLIFARRTRQIIDNNPKAKHPDGIDRDGWQSYIENIATEEGISPIMANRLYEKADAYFDIARDQLKQLYEEGIITEKQFNELKNFDYSRRETIDAIDPIMSYRLGGSKITVRESGVQSLSIGSEKQLLETDSRSLLSDLVIRTQNRIMANRAGKDMYKIAENNNNSPIVRIKNKETKIPKGWSPIDVFIDGTKKKMYMPDEFAREWVTKNREITYELGKFARIVSGSTILRSMATGINAGFAIKNLFRDLAYMWVASSHYTKDGGWTSTYSSFWPKAVVQQIRDLGSVAGDIVLRKGIYNEIAEQGVLLDFLSNKDRVMRERLGRGEKHVDAVIDALHYVSTTSELLGRAALYKRALRKGLDKKEAAFLAKDYLHFGDYGTFVKAADTVVPYLGATIKVTEGIWRAAKRNPAEFAMKATQVMVLGATIQMLNESVNKDAYDRIDDRDKQNNWIIPIYIPYTDKYGDTQYITPKIPKDSAQAFFAQVGAYAIDKTRGIDTDASSIVKSLKGLSPIQEVPSVPTVEAVMSYLTNMDFWTLKPAYPGAKQGEWYNDLSNEYRDTGSNPTNRTLVGIGKATGLSPDRMAVALSTVFTRGNYLTDAFTSLTDHFFDQLPEHERDMAVAEMLSKNSTLKGMIAKTNSYSEYRDTVDETEQKFNIDRTINNRNMDRLVENMYLYPKSGTTIEDVKTFLRSIPDRDERDRLKERFKRERQIVKLPHRILWNKMYDLVPEAAAEIMFKEVSKLSLEKRHDLLQEFNQANKIETIKSDRFMKRYKQLKANQ